MGRRPNLFIIGAAKSGTTSLYEYLAGHPDVFMSPVKEPFYFSPDVVATRPRYVHGADEAAYLDLFANARDEKWLGEASTRYMVSHEAPQLIRALDAEARIIVMLRNPVDLLYALHNERVSAGVEAIEDFGPAIAADAERSAGRNVRQGTNDLWAVYRNWACLGEQLQRWHDAFSAAQIHVIVFDDFATDTPDEFRKLLEFLDIDTSYVPESFAARRRSHRRRGGPLRRVLNNRLTKWAAHSALPAMLGRTRSSNLIWRFRQSRINRGHYEREVMAPELRRSLEEEFAPDVERLSTLVGRDLNKLWFGRPASA